VARAYGEDISFPSLTPATQASEINYPINRDQVVLGFAGLSVTRKDPDLINYYYSTKYLPVVYWVR